MSVFPSIKPLRAAEALTQQAFYAYFEERARKLKLDRIEFLTYSTKVFRNGREIKTPKCIQKAETLYNKAFSAGMHDRWLRDRGWSVGLGSMAANIKDVYQEAVRAAVAEAERRARLVLDTHAGVREFCMGMGCWVFSDAAVSVLKLEALERPEVKDLNDLVKEGYEDVDLGDFFEF